MKIKFNPTPSSPNESNDLKVNYGQPKRPISKWRFRIVLFIFLLPIILFAFYVVNNTISNLIYKKAPGYVILSQITIKAPYDAQVVYVKPQKSVVTNGETIAILKNNLIENQYKELLKSIDKLKLHKSALNDKSLLQTAKLLYNHRLKTYKEISYLRKIGAATQAEVANALSQLESAEIAYKQYENSLKENANPTIPVSDELKLNELKSIIQSLTIKSPQNATVASVFVKEGEIVNKNDDIMVLQNMRNPKIIAFFRPSDASQIVIGRKVKVKFPSSESLYAKIVNVKLQTQRLPADLTTPFKEEKLSLVVELEPLENIPNRLKVNYLPIQVYLQPNFFPF